MFEHIDCFFYVSEVANPTFPAKDYPKNAEMGTGNKISQKCSEMGQKWQQNPSKKAPKNNHKWPKAVKGAKNCSK